jgi:transposase
MKRVIGNGIRSWELTEELWERVRDFVPRRKRDIRPRGEEKQEKKKNPQFKARRWVVEICHSWLNRFRKLLVRYEKKERNYLALVELACAVIIWRNLIPVHPALILG